ncbi:MAG: PIN domain-containing protein [Thermomicrobiales bacterium]|nr:PIN domain-containing protein [Thermomicrobiales bacterium]
MSKPAPGLLDTNVFIHSLTNDRYSEECRAFIGRVETGEISVQLELCVLHELTYVYPRYIKQITRSELSTILLSVIEWPGVAIDYRDAVRLGLGMWGRTPGLGFVDAYLIAKSITQDSPVFTKNVREFRRLGALVPDFLP